jgi:hypothetical protein
MPWFGPYSGYFIQIWTGSALVWPHMAQHRVIDLQGRSTITTSPSMGQTQSVPSNTEESFSTFSQVLPPTTMSTLVTNPGSLEVSDTLSHLRAAGMLFQRLHILRRMRMSRSTRVILVFRPPLFGISECCWTLRGDIRSHHRICRFHRSPLKVSLNLWGLAIYVSEQ